MSGHSVYVLCRAEGGVLCSHGNLGAGWSCLGSGRPGCLDVPHHAAECSSGLEQRAGALPAFFFFLPLFASGTQLPHLTFSIWPLPRGEIARVSKRGRHTSWILLSFNLHSPFSPWWCTWIRNEDIAQLRGFLRLLLRYCSYFCAMPRFWCFMDMDIGFITFVWWFDIPIALEETQLGACIRNCIWEIKSPGMEMCQSCYCRDTNNFCFCMILFVYFNLISHS